MFFIKNIATSENKTNTMVAPVPIFPGVILIAIIGFRMNEMKKWATLRVHLSRKAPNANKGTLQKETSALPGTLPASPSQG